ncbi:hypothetical protein Bca4012_020449 [Brassica carinata]
MHGYQSRNFYHSETDQVPLAKAETELDTIFKEHIGYLEECQHCSFSNYWKRCDLKHTVSSTVDVCGMASSIFSLILKVKDCSMKTHIIQLSRKLTSQLYNLMGFP